MLVRVMGGQPDKLVEIRSTILKVVGHEEFDYLAVLADGTVVETEIVENENGCDQIYVNTDEPLGVRLTAVAADSVDELCHDDIKEVWVATDSELGDEIIYKCTLGQFIDGTTSTDVLKVIEE